MRINSTRNGRNKPTQQPVEALSHFTLALFTSRDVLRLAMSTLPQIMRPVFLVMFDVKSMRAGRWLGKPLNTRICGLKTSAFVSISSNYRAKKIKSLQEVIVGGNAAEAYRKFLM